MSKASMRAYMGELQGVSRVPVSIAARDWRVSDRRIRHLLCLGRLEGFRQANGQWLVSYPYRFTLAARGPVLKRFKPEQKEES